MNTAKVEFLIHAPNKEDALFAATQIWAALPWQTRNPASVRAMTPGIWSAVVSVSASPDTVLSDHHGLTRALQASGRPTDLGMVRPTRRQTP